MLKVNPITHATKIVTQMRTKIDKVKKQKFVLNLKIHEIHNEGKK